MADGGGFVLNIAASSGATRPAKKKRSSFRAKKNAKKGAKAKAAAGRGSGDGDGDGDGSAAPRKRQQPSQQQLSLGISRPNGPTHSGKRTLAASSKRDDAKTRLTPQKKQLVVAKRASPTTSHVAEAEKPEALNSAKENENENESESESENEKREKEEEEEEKEVEEPESSDDEIEAAVAVAAAGDPTPQRTARLSPPAAPKSAFGTRRNPNKEGYDVSRHTTTSTAIANVLDKPLESTSSDKIFAAKATFEAMALSPKLVQVLRNPAGSSGLGLTRPTNVQVQSVPAVLSGKDVLIKSETGSGKTLAYLLPIVQQLQAAEPRVERSRDGCLALVLAPTRELCLQILETAATLVQPFVYIVPGAIIGGEKKKAEKARLRKGICLLVATPGRLADHLVNTQAFRYSNLRFLVLDEADRLLDMGFEKQITQILGIIDRSAGDNRPRRQNVLVSATINSGVQQLASMSLSDPVRVDADALGSRDKREPETGGAVESFSTPHQLKQHFMIVPAKARLVALTCFLREELASVGPSGAAGSKVVVFMSTCDSVDFHYELFRKCAWPGAASALAPASTPAAATNVNAGGGGGGGDTSNLLGDQRVFRLHGTIPQHERMTTFKRFCAAASGVLLCTDVAARGLNLPTVRWIVQYDPPTETRDYVHRVGRTARSGRQGSSLLFLLPAEAAYLDLLARHSLSLSALSLEKTVARAAKAGGGGSDALAAAVRRKQSKLLAHEAVQSELQFLLEQALLGDQELFALACQAFHSFVRSYATHAADSRAIFHVRALHFGHVAKGFALREPPASAKLRDAGRGAKKGTLQKRKEREERRAAADEQRAKRQRTRQRRLAQQVAEFAA